MNEINNLKNDEVSASKKDGRTWTSYFYIAGLIIWGAFAYLGDIQNVEEFAYLGDRHDRKINNENKDCDIFLHETYVGDIEDFKQYLTFEDESEIPYESRVRDVYDYFKRTNIKNCHDRNAWEKIIYPGLSFVSMITFYLALLPIVIIIGINFILMKGVKTDKRFKTGIKGNRKVSYLSLERHIKPLFNAIFICFLSSFIMNLYTSYFYDISPGGTKSNIFYDTFFMVLTILNI